MKLNPSLCFPALGLYLLSTMVSVAAPAVDQKALAVVTSMSDKLKTAKTVKATGTRRLDPELIAGGVVKESVSFDLTLVRPGKICVKTTDAKGQRRLISDGKHLTLTDDTEKFYATVDAKGKSVDDLIAAIQGKLGFRPVLAEFLGSDPAKVLLDGVTAGSLKGEEVVEGVKCTRLAFTQPDAKWDLWVSASDGLPRKVVVTYTGIKGKPKATALITHWELGAKVPRKTFAFKPAPDYQKIEIIAAR